MRPWLWMGLILLAGACGDGGGSSDTTDVVVDGDDDDDAVGDDDDDGGDDDDDDDTTTLECEVVAANDLPDVLTLQERDDDYCESQPAYNPSVPYASQHFFSELTIDDCGNVGGTEFGLLYFNDRAFTVHEAADCMVVWNVSGVVDAGQGGADFGLDVYLERDFGASDCPFDPYEDEVFSGQAHYNVHVDAGTARFFFDNQTEPFAEGYANESHYSWFYDSCAAL